MCWVVCAGVCVQPDGSLALGAAVAYLSHLCGKQLPASVAIYAEVDVLSGVCGIVVTDATLRAARRAGITTIVLSERQVRGQDWELEWCFHVLDELMYRRVFVYAGAELGDVQRGGQGRLQLPLS